MERREPDRSGQFTMVSMLLALFDGSFTLAITQLACLGLCLREFIAPWLREHPIEGILAPRCRDLQGDLLGLRRLVGLRGKPETSFPSLGVKSRHGS